MSKIYFTHAGAYSRLRVAPAKGVKALYFQWLTGINDGKRGLQPHRGVLTPRLRGYAPPALKGAVRTPQGAQRSAHNRPYPPLAAYRRAGAGGVTGPTRLQAAGGSTWTPC